MRRFLSLALLLLSSTAFAQEAPPEESLFGKPRPTLHIGLHGGPVLVGGDVATTTRAKFGGGFGVDVGMRMFRHLYGGIAFDLQMFSTHETLSPQVQDNVLGVGFGPMFGWFTRPETLGGVLQLGLGGRVFAISNQTGTSNSYGSFEGRVMTGLTFPIGPLRMVLPRVDFYGGTDGTLTHATLSVGLSAGYDHDFSAKKRDF